MLPVYPSTKILPYVYMSVEKSSGNFYIGYRSANKTPSSVDFGKHYFTSNEYVRNNFDKFEHTIIAEFFDKKDAYAFELSFINETSSDKQINSFKFKKLRGKTYKEKEPFVSITKICPLPGCGREHSNWRTYCCSMGHQRKYAVLKRYLP